MKPTDTGERNMDNKQDVHTMTLHQQLKLADSGVWVLRVPGGWVYNYGGAAVFVPLNAEFATTT